MSAAPGTPNEGRRWLFVASPAMSDVAELLGWLRMVVDRGDVVLLRRRPATVQERERGVRPAQPWPGVETAAERIVTGSLRASVELVDDPVAEVPSCAGLAIGVRDLDPLVMPVIRAAEQAGVPGPCRSQGGHPFAQDEESRAGQAEAARVQAARDRNASRAVRAAARAAARPPASQAARQKARDAARPRSRGENPSTGRRYGQNDTQRPERRAG